MVLSKGGFDYKSLRTLGIVSKEKYLEQLKEITKRMYGNGKSENKDSVDIEQ